LEETKKSLFRSIVQAIQGLLLGTDGSFKGDAEARAGEIRRDLELVVQSGQKELCFSTFQLLLDTKHLDLLLAVTPGRFVVRRPPLRTWRSFSAGPVWSCCIATS